MNQAHAQAVAVLTQDPVDELGALLAQVSPLNKRVDELKKIIKQRGAGKYEGVLFSITVTQMPGKVTWDDAKLARLIHKNAKHAYVKQGDPYLTLETTALQG